jgi:hypothetical protein
VFGRFGEVEETTVRHRIDRQSGENTSWALVTMGSPHAAQAALRASITNPQVTHPLN